MVYLRQHGRLFLSGTKNLFYRLRFYLYAIFTHRFDIDYRKTKKAPQCDPQLAIDFTQEVGEIWNWSYSDWTDTPETRVLPNSECIKQDARGLRLITKKLEGNPDFDYQTGVLCSKHTWASLFDYRFTCAKPPAGGKRFWPAIWGWPDQMWPPEIDDVEFMGGDDGEGTYMMYVTSHWARAQGEKKTPSCHQRKIGLKPIPWLGIKGLDLSKHFHVYGRKWEPDKITYYLDDVAIFETIVNIPTIPLNLVLNNGASIESPPKEDELPGIFTIKFFKSYSINQKSKNDVNSDNLRVDHDNSVRPLQRYEDSGTVSKTFGSLE